MTSKKHLSTLQERQKESKICIMKEGGSGKINIANERQTRKNADMVEVCRYKVCWLGKKERKSLM
jgi:hypothetical protein